jgi:hypothetical protein|tara:strand:- start:648 stop:824 length:177 start_codon:yes stop_codon:yes gene_type:complete
MGIISRLIATSCVLLATDGRRHLNNHDLEISRMDVSQMNDGTYKQATGIVKSPLVQAT